MRSISYRTFFAGLIVSLLTLCPAIGGELDELQGRWEYKFTQGNRSLRAVKTISGNTETVETYDGGNLIHRHVVKIEIVPVDDYFLLRWGVAEVTHGPRKGEKPAEGSLISKRLGKDVWYNITGLRKDESFPVQVQTFIRLKESEL